MVLKFCVGTFDGFEKTHDDYTGYGTEKILCLRY